MRRPSGRLGCLLDVRSHLREDGLRLVVAHLRGDVIDRPLGASGGQPPRALEAWVRASERELGATEGKEEGEGSEDADARCEVCDPVVLSGTAPTRGDRP